MFLTSSPSDAEATIQQYFISTCYVPSPVLGLGILRKKIGTVPASEELTVGEAGLCSSLDCKFSAAGW